MSKNYRTHAGDEIRQQILEYLKENIVTFANVSYRDIGDELGISSPSVVNFHLDQLEKEGKIRRIGASAIEVLDDDND